MIATILLLLWFLGIANSYTLGGLIHLLLVIAAVAVFIRATRNNRTIRGSSYRH